MGIATRMIGAARAGTIARLWASAIALLSASAAALAVAAPANAGTYVVAQCDSAQPGFADAHFDRTIGAYYEMTRGCSSSAEQRALRIDNIAAAPVAAEGRIRWSAPDGAGIVGVSAEASLREDAGHRARLSFLDAAGRQAGRVGTGRDGPGGFTRYSQKLDGVGRAGFAALLICAEQRPCPESEQARAAIRNVRLTVKDHATPVVTTSGTVLAAGWIRGRPHARRLGPRRGLRVELAGRQCGREAVADLEVVAVCDIEGRRQCDVSLSADGHDRRRNQHRTTAVPRRHERDPGLRP